MSAETIYALGTGATRSAIAVIRLSGPGTGDALRAIAGETPPGREVRLARFRDPESNETLDRGLLLWFPGPASVTGEDYAEFQIHGGQAVIEGLLTILERQPGLRPALPGEFARRSFENGKLDLSQIEGLADLIEAQTAFQRRQALRVMGGDLRRRVEAWRARLIEGLAMVEAELDFSDEGDVAAAQDEALAGLLECLLGEMRAVLAEAPASERLREGYVVFILGPPNAGKSTLMNALARRDVAIVSEIAGTTRDLIEAHVNLKGMPVVFVDTAGLRDSRDEIEKIGVARTLDRARRADLLLWLSEGGGTGPAAEIGGEGAEILSVATKSDSVTPVEGSMAISAKTGAGLEGLYEEIFRRAKASLGDGGSSFLLRRRQREAVERAALGIETALLSKPLEIKANELHGAARALGAITGAVDVEDVLDKIFAQFCIGK